MKKLLLISTLILISFDSIYSQVDHPFNIGINAAPGIAWMKTNSRYLSSGGSDVGFLYGFMCEYYFAADYGLSTGLNVIYDGGNITDDNSQYYSNDIKYKLQYLEIPVTLKLKTKQFGYMSYFVQFGVGGSFNLKANADNEVTQTNPVPPGYVIPDNETNQNVTTSKINMFRTSFIVGGGVEYSLRGDTKILAGVTFNNGLTNILKGKTNIGINNFLGLNLGIIF